MFKKRQYQIDTVQAWYPSLGIPGNKPVVAVPTAAGKTIIMCMLLQGYLYENPDNEVLILSHTKDILEQDIRALESFFPDKIIGAYSAGLGRKEHEQITVAGIQSAHNNPDLFRWANLVIIDEVHCVNHKNTGRYRDFLERLKHSVITGMSATIYRTGHGYIHKGEGALFTSLAYDLTSLTNFNKLIDDGYLCKPIAPSITFQLDSSKIAKSGGDYNLKQLSNTHDKKHITKTAIDSAILYGKKYKKWLVFAIDIEHAENINKELKLNGIKSEVLHSKSKGDESEIKDNFTNGDTRALVSVGKVTTGFDAPIIDLILILRPTSSVVLHIQMIGRGARIHPDKDHFLVLDFCGNIKRLGPINDPIIPKSIKKGKGKGEPPIKTCPNCSTMNHTITKYCDSCNYEFTFKTRLTTTSSSEEILKRTKTPKHKWMKVTSVSYSIHHKKDAPDSILITYFCGLRRVREWLCVDHQGYAGNMAKHKLKHRGYSGVYTTKGVMQNKHRIKVPARILVNTSSKYKTVENLAY